MTKIDTIEISDDAGPSTSEVSTSPLKDQKIDISDSPGPSKCTVSTPMHGKGIGNSQTTPWYDSYAVLLWDSDEDDVDMAEAIKASLEDQNRATQASLEAPDLAIEECTAADTKALEVIKEVTLTQTLMTM